MSKSEKFRVYVIRCNETDLGKVYTESHKVVGDLIAGDIENNSDQEGYTYTVSVQYMTRRQINNLPEYEP